MSYQKYELKYKFKTDKFIFVPSEVSRIHGLKIKKELEKQFKIPSFYQHLLPKGHVKAIKKHLFQHWFIKADLKNFFYNITQTKITRSLNALLHNYEKARYIAKVSTVTSEIDKKKIFHLPYGFIQSPIIASICLNHSGLGQYLHWLDSNGYKVSVYVDDIIISGKEKDDPIKVLDQLKKLSIQSNLPLNSDKTFISYESITAFNIDLTFNQTLINPESMKVFQEILKSKCSSLKKEAIQKYINDVERV